MLASEGTNGARRQTLPNRARWARRQATRLQEAVAFRVLVVARLAEMRGAKTEPYCDAAAEPALVLQEVGAVLRAVLSCR
jgi:hypothetical protein